MQGRWDTISLFSFFETSSVMDSEITSLKADRAALRVLEAGDAQAMTAMMQNWNVLRMLSSPPYPYRLADAQDFIASRREQGNTPEDCTFAIVVENALAGVISIEPNTEDQPELSEVILL